MSRFVSKKNPVSARVLKRRSVGAVVRRHGGREDVTSERPSVVSSASVARECNTAVGCQSSWAKVY